MTERYSINDINISSNESSEENDKKYLFFHILSLLFYDIIIHYIWYSTYCK